MADAGDSAPIGVIGGSGLYEFVDDSHEIDVETPFGKPAAPVSVGVVADRRVAFLPRHGRRHEFPPHRVNYRANIWALRTVGVRRVLAPCAVGSLRPDVGPGAVLIPDQLVDRTTSRVQTFMDDGAVHVSFADPYCAGLRAAVADAHPDAVKGGTMVVVEGPRFSTRAESQWYAGLGWSLVNMTGHPEAVLARELAMCYAAIALVTDHDAGMSTEESVSQALVFAEFARNVEALRSILRRVIAAIDPIPSTCSCSTALDGMHIPFELP